MLFGERLSLLRNERQMKQEDLGKIFHLSKSTISTYGDCPKDCVNLQSGVK